MSRVKYCLRPGWVVSQNDGERHYVGVGALFRLYGLQPGQFRVHDSSDICKDLEHLGVSRLGNYRNVNEEAQA